jgi:hypothetical protein
VYNATEGRWDVLYCEQMTLYARASVNNSSGFIYSDDTVTIDGFTALGFSLYTLYPTTLPTTAGNARKHRGLDNDEVWLMWDSGRSRWEIIDVTDRPWTWIVKPSSNTGSKIAKGATGNVTVLKGRDSGVTFTGVTAEYAEVIDGKECTCWQDDDGNKYVAPGECQ